MFGDLGKMMKQAQALQAKMGEIQEEVAKLAIEGSAGAGLVGVTLDGRGALIAVRIDPTLLKPEEVEIVEDLVIAAHADAKHKVDAAVHEKMREATGGLELPAGLKLPF